MSMKQEQPKKTNTAITANTANKANTAKTADNVNAVIKKEYSQYKGLFRIKWDALMTGRTVSCNKLTQL